MSSKFLLRNAAVALGLALSAASAAATPAPDPAADAKALDVIAQAKAAMGGAAWDELKGWHEVGVHNGARYETWLDPRQYGMATRESGPGGMSAHGFDGRVAWQTGADGVVASDDSAEAVAAAEQSDYLRLNGYFLPDRFKAAIAYVGATDEAGRTYDVVHVTPAGSGADVWFDQETHLPSRIVIHEGASTLTIRYADYRVVGGVLAPFHTMVSDGDPTHDDDARITVLDFGATDRGLFAPSGPAGPTN
ncbi:MAG TPA: hypothetical protein VME40_04400 [Caulobacteraceae bacterium]|nr:hypothetical protein [Caulobacteraceae bacterium]